MIPSDGYKVYAKTSVSNLVLWMEYKVNGSSVYSPITRDVLNAGYILNYLYFKNLPAGLYLDTDVDIMLCTTEDYDISPEFVPYAPSNRELHTTSGLRLVASDILRSSSVFTYKMNMTDFDKDGVGTYIISVMTWSTTPKYSLYAVSYTGGTFNYTVITKIAGSDLSITVENGVITVPGLGSYGGKVSIHALQ